MDASCGLLVCMLKFSKTKWRDKVLSSLSFLVCWFEIENPMKSCKQQYKLPVFLQMIKIFIDNLDIIPCELLSPCKFSSGHLVAAGFTKKS